MKAELIQNFEITFIDKSKLVFNCENSSFIADDGKIANLVLSDLTKQDLTTTKKIQFITGLKDFFTTSGKTFITNTTRNVKIYEIDQSFESIVEQNSRLVNESFQLN